MPDDIASWDAVRSIVSLIDGDFRTAIEAEGNTFDREVAAIKGRFPRRKDLHHARRGASLGRKDIPYLTVVFELIVQARSRQQFQRLPVALPIGSGEGIVAAERLSLPRGGVDGRL